MIPRSDMDAYSEALGRIGGSAEGAAVRAVRAVVAASRAQGLTVAETREQAKAVLEPVATAYGDAAAQLAAEFYDMCAAGGLDPAEVPAGDFADVVDSTVRYQIRKLMDGDAEGFARACGELARNVTGRRAAETAIRNARRDRGSGVRFARVPSGTETCAFCRMLASRGFVYWTKETAGALDHYHRGCDCMVVASNDPEGAEGYDPDRERELWKRFEEIDAEEGLSSAEKTSEKRAVIGAAGPPVTYEKPLSAFAHEAGGARDVEAHEALRAAGHAVVVRKENAPEGFSNIDLLLDGRLCELKSPTSAAAGINGLRFIERNIRKAVRQFEKAVGGPVRPSIVVLNCVGMRLSRADALKRVRLEMGRHDIDRVILLTDGGIDDLKK